MSAEMNGRSVSHPAAIVCRSIASVWPTAPDGVRADRQAPGVLLQPVPESGAGGQHRPGRVDALQLERIEQSGKELADLGGGGDQPSWNGSTARETTDR